MYRFTVHMIEGSKEIAAPEGCTLHSVVYAPPERLVCVWEQDASLVEVGWGETTWALREKNDPVFIDGSLG